MGLSGRKAWPMIITVSGSLVLHAYILGAMNVATPSVGDDLDFSQSDLAWPLQAYNLVSGCVLLLAGRLADRFGRRNVFICGTIWFAVFSIPPIFAPNPASFNTFMGLLGIGAAIMNSAGIGVLGGNLEGTLKNRAFTVLSAGQGMGYIAGLVSSGFLCQLHRGWRYIFILQASYGALFSVFAFLSVPRDIVKFDRDMDWPGLALSLGGLTLLTFSLSQSQNVGWKVPYIPILLALSITILATFLYWEWSAERRGKSVLISLTLFEGYQFSAFFAMMFFVWWPINVLQYFMTLYYEKVQGLSPSHTGVKFAPEAVSGIIVNITCGILIEYVPAGWLNAFGIGATAASAAILAVIESNVSYWRNAFLVMILIPASDTNFIVGSLFTVNALDEKSQALAGALFATSIRISTAIGLSITSTVVSNVIARSKLPASAPKDPASLLRGYHAAGWVCFACAVLAICCNFAAFWGMGVLGRRDQASIRNEENDVEAVEGDEEKRRA